MTRPHEGPEETPEALGGNASANDVLGRRRESTHSRCGVVVTHGLDHRAEDDCKKTEEDSGVECR